MSRVVENTNDRVVLLPRPDNLRHHFSRAVDEFCTKDDICEILLLSSAEKRQVMVLYAEILSQHAGGAFGKKIYDKSLASLGQFLIKAEIKLEQRHSPDNIRKIWREDLGKIVDALVYLGENARRAPRLGS